jgi:uncharacterized integral membrane protein (TIGR00698 family)
VSDTASPRTGIAAAIALAALAILTARALGDALIPAGKSALSPVLCAVLIGMLWRNVVGVDPRWLPGLQWVTQTLLRVGIALVGLRLTLDGIGSSVTLALPVVAACIATAIFTSLLIGRVLGVSAPLQSLLAAGTAVCGCTAVIAVSPVVRAEPGETGVALTCVVIVGCAGMIGYPWLAHLLFADQADAAAVFLATSIHDTSQVLAAALIYAQQFDANEVAPLAAFTKLLRNLSLLLLLPAFAVLGSRRFSRTASVDSPPGRAEVLPAFLIWFVVLGVLRIAGDLSLANTHGSMWSAALSVSFSLSEALLVCGMTAVGLSVSLGDLRGVGKAALLTALAVAAAAGFCSLLMTTLMQRLA